MAFVKRLGSLGSQLWHGAQVFGHVAGEVAAKEQFGLPALSEFGQAQKEFQQMVKNTQSLKFLEYTLGQALQKAAAGFSVVTFFIVGEIVGRRSIIGYRY